MPDAPAQQTQIPLVLASGSPRRRELLSEAGVVWEAMPADIDESVLPGESPRDMALRLAEQKARVVAGRISRGTRRHVLGADTTVVLDGEIIGKPADPEDALSLLRRLTGRTHTVVTAVAIVDTDHPAPFTFALESRVSMREASERELRDYVATGEPLDKAGAYAIQGQGAWLVTHFEGSRTNIIGLPVEETLEMLERAGYPLPSAAPES